MLVWVMQTLILTVKGMKIENILSRMFYIRRFTSHHYDDLAEDLFSFLIAPNIFCQDIYNCAYSTVADPPCDACMELTKQIGFRMSQAIADTVRLVINLSISVSTVKRQGDHIYAGPITFTPGRSHLPPGDHILPRAHSVPDLAS